MYESEIREGDCAVTWIPRTFCAHCLGHKPDFDLQAVMYQ